jgi:hypothetical protein
VWLSLDQLSELFGRDTSVIAKHIKNIFKDGELQKEATSAKFANVQTGGKRRVRREYEYYNLDVIISLGYKINSKRGIEFRKWSTEILK